MGTPFWLAYEQFHLRCDSQNLSPGTMLWYRQIARGLERFLVESRAPDDVEIIAARHIRGYFSALRSGGMSSETAHRYYGGLRCLFKFWRREGILKNNPMELVEKPRRERHMIRPLTPEQVQALLGQVGAADFLSLRNRALMLLMLDSGLRLTEALTLRLTHLDLEGGTALVMGKGRKERKVPFANAARQALEVYLKDRRMIQTDHDLLIVSRRGRRLTSRHVQLMVKRCGRKAAITGVRVSPHTLRHTFATQYIKNGGDAFSLQMILGHSTLEMVRNYVNLASRDVNEQHRKFSPMDRLFE